METKIIYTNRRTLEIDNLSKVGWDSPLPNPKDRRITDVGGGIRKVNHHPTEVKEVVPQWKNKKQLWNYRNV